MERKIYKNLMLLLLALNKAIDQLAMANSVRWYGHVLRREDGYVLRREDGHVLRREDDHVLRRALDYEVEGMKVSLWRKIYFIDQSGLLVLIGLPLGCGESGHPHLLGILPVVSGHPHLLGILPVVSGHPHLLGILPVVSGHPHLLKILPVVSGHPHLLRILPVVSGHPHLLGILPDLGHWSLSV